uniref:hypothetical protein n=1 Tax=Paracoccus mutanolyticus TaxID=1499308 RepID=UPI0037CB9C3B
MKGSDGEVPLLVPRDRDGSFEPELVKKGQRPGWMTRSSGSMPPGCRCATSSPPARPIRWT